MNNIIKRIIIGALAISIPVGGSIFFLTRDDSKEEANKNNIEEKDQKGGEQKGSEKDDKGSEKKNDNEKHPGTDAIGENEHSIKIDSLKNTYHNSEVVGYISIPNTSISSVVVQHNDNDYYLNHSATNESNVEGAIYLDYRVDINSGRKNIIYGHNGDSANLNVPFSELEKYYEKTFFDNNQFIYLEDSTGVGKYQIFSVFVETRDPNYLYLNFKNDSSWFEHISYLKNKSLYDTGVSIDATDDVLLLQTCSHNEDYSKYKSKYLVVVAKRVSYEQ